MGYAYDNKELFSRFYTTPQRLEQSSYMQKNVSKYWFKKPAIKKLVNVLCQPAKSFPISLSFKYWAHEQFQRTTGKIRPWHFTLGKKKTKKIITHNVKNITVPFQWFAHITRNNSSVHLLTPLLVNLFCSQEWERDS